MTPSETKDNDVMYNGNKRNLPWLNGTMKCAWWLERVWAAWYFIFIGGACPASFAIGCNIHGFKRP